MTPRNSDKRAENQLVFETFLAAYPDFASRLTSWRQPTQENAFPDVIVTVRPEGEIYFELTQWLDSTELQRKLRYERLACELNRAIGEASVFEPIPAFGAVMLVPRPEMPQFDPTDRDLFHGEIAALCERTHRRWPTESHWRSPAGRSVTDFDTYPTLRKYLARVEVGPGRSRPKSVEADDSRPRPFVKGFGGPARPAAAVDALTHVIENKTGRYGPVTPRVRLLVFYWKAAAYNTPYYSIDIDSSEDVARVASEIPLVKDQLFFDKIYLLSFEKGVGAFEIFPSLARCA